MRVDVVGGGIIGLSCAAELVSRRHDVQVWDPAPSSGASAVAAGMLSPAGEAWHGESDLFRLGSLSARMWPRLAADLGVELHHQGTVVVGHDVADAQLVQRQAEVLARFGQDVDVLRSASLRELEPGLGRVVLGLRVQDRAVDPRAVMAALRARLGDRVHLEEHASSRTREVDAVVVATGARLPSPWTPLVRGVRGEIVRVRTDDPPSHVVRGWVAGEPVYLVPRGGGEIVVGATMEEHDRPPIVTAGGVLRLLRAARVLVPSIDRAEVLACEARDRPATPDHLPLIGPTASSKTLLAAGHYRHGVLLAPLTARMLADALEGGEVDPAVDPRRFSTPKSPEGVR